MQRRHAIVTAARSLAIMFVVGCSGANNDQDDSANDTCSLKRAACLNSCYKADLGFGCTTCCRTNDISCRTGGNYNFQGCPDK